jgi:rhodanese-related sulfurtransferase
MSTKQIDLSPADVKAGLEKRSIVLVDVREPAEFAAERVHGALNYPLSTFDPAALGVLPMAQVVFQCGTGKRSGMAIERCVTAGLPIVRHLKGGIAAWKSSSLPTVSLDAGTGQVRDKGSALS